jgi:hypothetical protein
MISDEANSTTVSRSQNCKKNYADSVDTITDDNHWINLCIYLWHYMQIPKTDAFFQ